MNKKSNRTKKINVIAIVGATASGKTAYSIELAKQIDGEIISADSRLVYKGFDIGTAKPTIEEQSGIPHYMIDIVEPEFDYSAGLYKQQASEIIEKIHLKGKTPIIVGGTGLYIDILLKNYDLPKVEPDRLLREELKLLSREDLYEKLQIMDCDAAKKIDKNDTKKIIRAIEIITVTGKSLSASQGLGEIPYNIEWIGRNFEREVLYSRIDKRVDIMIEQGLIEETKCLLIKHGAIPNLVNTIGYREIYGYLTNKYSLEEGIDLLKKNTRNYAKRQLTWFRKNNLIKWNVFPEKLKK
jgi:tRNA dimethylallyltransferase